MLTSAHIRNFRACKDVRLDDLGFVLALVGRNAAGKSTILQALAWLAGSALATDAFDRLAEVDPGEALADPGGELELTTEHGSYRYTIGRVFGNDPTVPAMLQVRDLESLSFAAAGSPHTWQGLFTRENDVVTPADPRAAIKVHPGTAAMPALASILPKDHALQPHLRAVMDVLRRIRYYAGHGVFYPDRAVPDEPDGPVSEDIFNQWVASHESGRRRTSLVLRLIWAHETRDARLDELRQLMGPEGLGLLEDIRVLTFGEVDTPARGRSRRYYDVVFVPTDYRAELSLAQISGGTRHILYLLLGLLFDDSSTMLIEQPEDGIHPALLAKVIDLLRVNADPTQIIFTSHSPTVLSCLSPLDIRLVEMQGGATRVRALSADEVQRATAYMQQEGSLAEFLELIQGS